MAKHLLTRFVVSLAVSTALAACNSSSTTAPSNVVAQLTAGALGQAQVAVVGQTLVNPLTVTVSDAAGNPITGATVNFTVISGGGTLSAGTALSNENGGASVQLTLGTRSGVDSVVATANGMSVTFVETAKADVAAALMQVSGDSAAVAMGDSTTLVVRVVDRFGNAISGAAIAWVAGTGAQLGAQASVTAADGTASAVVDVGALGQIAITVMLASNQSISTIFVVDGT